MEEILIAMGFDPRVVHQCVAERPTASIEQVIERIFARSARDAEPEPAAMSRAKSDKKQVVEWETIPALQEILSDIKKNFECFDDAAKMQSNNERIVSLLLDKHITPTTVVNFYKAVNTAFAQVLQFFFEKNDYLGSFLQFFSLELAKICVDSSDPADLVSAVSKTMLRYKHSIAWTAGITCPAVELVDSAWVLQRMRSVKGEAAHIFSRDAGTLPHSKKAGPYNPLAVGRLESAWDQFIACSLSAPLDDQDFAANGILSPAPSTSPSNIPPEVSKRF